MNDVRVGQVWRSRDKRDYDRTVTVIEIPSSFVNGFVTVQSFRRSRIRADNFVRQYELVKDVPA